VFLRSWWAEFDVVLVPDASGLLSLPATTAVDDISGTLMETDGLAGAVVDCAVFEALSFGTALLPKSYALTPGTVAVPPL